MLLLWCTLLVWCSSSSGAVAVPLRQNVSIPAIIAFGDSLVDQGNNNYLVTLVKCNFQPYGEDYIGRMPTGRFSNAKTPPDMIGVSKLGIKKLLPPYLDPNLRSEDLLTGVSFASGGSGYDPLTSATGSVLSFANELELFKEYISKLTLLVGEKRTKHILANSVFVVVSASNDFVNTYFTLGLRRGEYDIPSYADFIVAHASDFVQAIYDLGARKIAVFGLAPIGCLPFSRTLAGGLGRNCVETYNEAAQIYNAKLISKIHGLGHSLPHSKIVYADIYKPLLDIIHNPKKYGFDVVDKGCCGTGNLEVAVLCNKLSKTCPHRNSFLFWDSFHPTERGYEIVVDHFLRNEFIKHFL